MDAKDRVILWKFWLQRSYSYLTIVNSLMLMYLTIKSKFPDVSMFIVLPIALGMLVILVIAGMVEDKIGMARRELELNARRMGLLKKGE